MLTPEILLSIDAAVLCWLATSDAKGQPNVSPKEVFMSYGMEHLLIANILSPQSVKNIKANPLVSVSFIDVLVQKGFQLKGTAHILTKRTKAFKKYHPLLASIAGPDFPIASIIDIHVDSHKEILAPRYQLFPDTTASDQVKRAMEQYGLK